MPKNLSRRELLKLGSLLPFAYHLPTTLYKPASQPPASDSPNILIIVLDALSAANMSLFGYPRETTPNISRLADRATVYHNHYASGTFTFPGTASLLSGTYPWTHRAFFWDQAIPKELRPHNMFELFPDYYSAAYTHNIVAANILNYFGQEIDLYKPRTDLYLQHDAFIEKIFKNDADTAQVGWFRTIKKTEGYSYSLMLSELYRSLKSGLLEEWEQQFPRGLPNVSADNFFVLETAVDWTLEQVATISNPFMGYFHYLPPHNPYLTRAEFINRFKGDGIEPKEKPIHPLSDDYDPNFVTLQHRWYDEFILYADAEFGRLFKTLEDTGALENTWLILTSDHGEIFERGFFRHLTKSMHQPLVKIPLLIFEPGQTQRRDVFANTNAVDLLPTLLQLTGRPTPDWVEGTALPPYRETAIEEERSIFSLDSKEAKPSKPLPFWSAAIIKDRYKLLNFYKYSIPGQPDLIELYDLENDPEELNDLSKTQSSLAAELLAELKGRIAAADDRYLAND